MTFQLRPATDAEFHSLMAQTSADFMRQVSVVVAEANGQRVAMAGISREGGRVWGFLDVGDGAKDVGVSILRNLRRALRGIDAPVYVQCASRQAERLLRIIGFKPTKERRGEAKVWRYG